MTPEGQVKKDIDKFLQSLGDAWWGFKPMMNGYGRKGIPDIIGCYRGMLVAIEAKAPGKVPNQWQLDQLAAIADSGGRSVWADNVEDVIKKFDTWFGVRAWLKV